MPFRDVVGHRRLVHLLSRAIREQSLPPSLIFAGPAGIGKRLVALSTAQALNCTDQRLGSAGGRGSESARGAESTALPIDACGVCPACTRIARGVHADVLFIEPGDTGSIKIEQVREIVDRVGYRPFEGRRRVVIIDDAEALVPAAQNALLKTLEEPPSLSVFVLISSQPDTLLATVRSRCHQLRFQALDAADVTAALMKLGRSETDARVAALTADGSAGRALEADGADLVLVRDVAVRVLTQAAASDDPRRRVEGAKDLLAKTGTGGSERDQLATHLRAMASLLRDVELLDRRRVSSARQPGRPARDGPADGVSRRARRAGVFRHRSRDRGAQRNAGVKIVADWLVLQL